MNAADRRPLLLAVATTNAVLLYLDRICMGEIVKTDLFRAEMGLSKEQTGALMSSFFFAYALGQVPAGYLADRFGPRRMLAVYVALWSLFTAATGLASGLAGLIAWRVLTGLSEAGAYPASGRMIRAWFGDASRGRASSCVATGGRVGNAAALFLTASLIAALGAWRPVLWLYGSFGIVLAAMSWLVFRDEPGAGEERTPASDPKQFSFPFKALISHRPLWLFCLAQFGGNFGTALGVTWMPSYLKDALHVPDKTVSAWLSISLLVGLLGMPLGGVLSDWSQQRFGPRKGRIYVVATFLTLAGLVFVIPLLSRNPVHVVLAIGAVEFLTLCTTPAIWAIGQQIGGPHAALTMAWGNAWGNLGAAILPLIVPWFKDAATGEIAWPVIFALCLGAYLISAIAAALVRQDRPLLPGAERRG